MLNLLGIFLAAVALDVAWVFYMEAAGRGTTRAALWSMVLGVLGFWSVDAVLTGWLARVIWVCGLGLGTSIGIHLEKSRKSGHLKQAFVDFPLTKSKQINQGAEKPAKGQPGRLIYNERSPPNAVKD